MFIILFIIVGTLFLAREISGYDSRYNIRKHFILKNNKVAKLLLPKTKGSRSTIKRSISDFNKMTYVGAVFYLCNLFIILSIPTFLFLVPEIQVQPFEFDTRYIYILVDTLNLKLPVLFSLILLAIEIIFVFINVIVQAKKQNKKWMIILSSILMIMIVLFGFWQVEELVTKIIEVFS